MTVLDASAVLAYLQNEPGSDRVRHALEGGATISTANWAEVAQKLRRVGSWNIARSLLLSYPLAISSVTIDEAEAAAALWESHPTLSLGDRLCLALAGRLDAVALTADRDWRGIKGVELIR
ncbi:MAG: PIN domain-containing protein [Microcella sp.]